MADPIMVLGAFLFSGLFVFLAFLFLVFLISLTRRDPVVHLSYRPSVSVLIPAHDEEARIAACIAAVQANRYKDAEIIVIDDGSTDHTARVARAMDARVVRQAHRGKSAALQRGYRASRGEIIVVIDADTIVEQDFLAHITQPFRDPRVGTTSGTVLVGNDRSLAGMFQRVEYHYNNLIRRSFSSVFANGIWFFGCLSAYRRDALARIGGFPDDTMAEDMDVAMSLRAAGYRTLYSARARGKTTVPTSLRALFLQRSRWWVGGLQSLRKHRGVYRTDRNLTSWFILANHAWWALYAFLSIPLIAYQVWYWFPQAGAADATLYLVRWFTIWGPFYVLYKIPVWGISPLNIFGVLSGVITLVMLVGALRIYRERPTLRDVVAIALYFPYTIILNLFVAGSVIRALTTRQRTFLAT